MGVGRGGGGVIAITCVACILEPSSMNVRSEPPAFSWLTRGGDRGGGDVVARGRQHQPSLITKVPCHGEPSAETSSESSAPCRDKGPGVRGHGWPSFFISSCFG